MKIIRTSAGYGVIYPANNDTRKTKTFKTIIETLDFAAYITAEWATSIPQEIRTYLEYNDHHIFRNQGMREFIRIEKRR
jgi:hypothetical protein